MLAYRDATLEQKISYPEPVFDQNKVYECFNEVLSNPIYEQNMKKL